MARTEGWRGELVLAARGSQTGAIVSAALHGDKVKSAPRFVGKAAVTSDGFVMCTFVDRNRETHLGAFVGSLDDLVRNLVGLADHCGLVDEERSEYARACSEWIGSDYTGSAAERIRNALR